MRKTNLNHYACGFSKCTWNLRLLLLYFILHFNNEAALGQKYSDSISFHLQQYELSTKNDSARLFLFLQLSADYSRYNYDSLLFYARQSLQLSQQMKYTRGIGYALNGLEFGLRETGAWAEALNVQLQALTLAREVKDKNLEALELNSIGNTYMELGDYKTGLAYYNSSHSLFTELNDAYWTRNEISNMGNAFEKLNLLDSALLYEMRMYRDAAFPRDLFPELCWRLGSVHVKLGKDSLAMKFYKEGIPASFQLEIISDRAVLYYQLSVLYSRLQQYDSGISYAKKAFLTAQKISFRKVILDGARQLGDTYYKAGKPDSAYFYQQIAIRYNDTLFGAEKFRNIQLVLSKEQQRQQQLVQDREKMTSRYQISAAASLLLFTLLILLFVVRNNRIQKKANQLLSKQKEQISAHRETAEAALTELKTTQSQLIQSEKMASLGELTAGIAHEIQNPLNFVNNFSEVSRELLEEMEEALQQNDKEEAIAIAGDIKENLGKINHHGKRADAIVKGMLQHSRANTGRKEPTDINALADEYLRLAYHGLRAKDKSFNVKLETHFDESLGNIDVVQQDVGRVLLNLFNNAFYAVNEKKKQLIGAYEPAVFVSTNRVNNKVEIRVKDNGTGIPQKVAAKIFQPFFTTKPTGEGTGLGLSLSYDIIKAYGGELKVETGEGEGSVFTIGLPIL